MPAAAEVGGTIPRTPDDLTPSWVEAAFAAGGAPALRIASLEKRRIGEGVGMMTELYRLDLTYAPDTAPGPASVVAKLHSANDQARGLCALFSMYEREVRFYQDIAPTIAMRTPIHYFSAHDAASGDCVVLLEDLAPALSPDQVAGIPLDKLTAAIDAAAALHARWWDAPELAAMRPLMPSINRPPYAYSVDNFRACLPVAVPALERLGQHALIPVIDKLSRTIGRLMDEMSEGPWTLNHGDFRTDNLMFRSTAEGLELTVVDWQIVMQMRGPYDIGYLMGGAVPTELRRAEEMRLLRRYHDALLAGGVDGYSFEACLLDYRRYVLVGVSYLVQALPAIDWDNPRGVALFRSWAERLTAAIADLDLEPFVD